MGHHDHRIDWRAILFYGLASALVLIVGGVVLFSFFEKQSLLASIAPEPLPRVTIVTQDPNSKLAAGWVSLLTRSEFSPTLVPMERFEPVSGVVAVCGIDQVSPRLIQQLDQIVSSGGGLVVLGAPPDNYPLLGLTSKPGMSDSVLRLSDAVSPLMARVNPGHEMGGKPVPVALIDETPKMSVDARWKDSARAAVVHYPFQKSRVVWLGFDPDALFLPDDRQMSLFLRTAMRWADGQPVSDGAIGTPVSAKTFSPEARMDARASGFSFSVDRLEKEGVFSVRVTNRGKKRISNPTVRFWFPPGVGSISLAGSYVSRRRVDLVPLPEEDSVLVTLPVLEPNENRYFKLKTGPGR